MTFIANPSDILKALCVARKQWGILLAMSSAPEDFAHTLDEAPMAAPWLGVERAHHLAIEGQAFALFDSEAEMQAAYWQTVGDDGPTEANPYDGPVKVHALTCDPTGQLLNENT